MSTVDYTFKYIKDGVEHSSDHTFANEPTFAEVEAQMNSYAPDTKVDYIRHGD